MPPENHAYHGGILVLASTAVCYQMDFLDSLVAEASKCAVQSACHLIASFGTLVLTPGITLNTIFGHGPILLVLYYAEVVFVKLPAVVCLLVRNFRQRLVLLAIEGRGHQVCLSFPQESVKRLAFQFVHLLLRDYSLLLYRVGDCFQVVCISQAY